MNTSTILIELVEKFKRNSLQAFTAPIRLTLKAKKKKRQRALRNREAQVWEIATMEVSWAIERLAVELRKRAEPGSVIEKREEEPLTSGELLEISSVTGIKESKVRAVSLMLSRGETLREISQAVGISLKNLRKLLRMFPRCGFPERA